MAYLMLLQPCPCLAPHLPSPTTEPTSKTGHHASSLPTTICLWPLLFVFKTSLGPSKMAFLADPSVTLTCDRQVTLVTVKNSRVPSILGPCLWPLLSSPPGLAHGTVSWENSMLMLGKPRGQKEHTQVTRASPHTPPPISHQLQLHEEALSPGFPELDTPLPPLSSFPDFSGL